MVFITDNYILVIVILVVIVMTVIGYIADKNGFGSKESIEEIKNKKKEKKLKAQADKEAKIKLNEEKLALKKEDSMKAKEENKKEDKVESEKPKKEKKVKPEKVKKEKKVKPEKVKKEKKVKPEKVEKQQVNNEFEDVVVSNEVQDVVEQEPIIEAANIIEPTKDMFDFSDMPTINEEVKKDVVEAPDTTVIEENEEKIENINEVETEQESEKEEFSIFDNEVTNLKVNNSDFLRENKEENGTVKLSKELPSLEDIDSEINAEDNINDVWKF